MCTITLTLFFAFVLALYLSPVIDGSNAGLLRLPIDTIKTGDQAKVPLVIGTVLDEVGDWSTKG